MAHGVPIWANGANGAGVSYTLGHSYLALINEYDSTVMASAQLFTAIRILYPRFSLK